MQVHKVIDIFEVEVSIDLAMFILLFIDVCYWCIIVLHCIDLVCVIAFTKGKGCITGTFDRSLMVHADAFVTKINGSCKHMSHL